MKQIQIPNLLFVATKSTLQKAQIDSLLSLHLHTVDIHMYVLKSTKIPCQTKSMIIYCYYHVSHSIILNTILIIKVRCNMWRDLYFKTACCYLYMFWIIKTCRKVNNLKFKAIFTMSSNPQTRKNSRTTK